MIADEEKKINEETDAELKDDTIESSEDVREDKVSEESAADNEDNTSEEASAETTPAAEMPQTEDDDLQTKFLRLSADFQNFRRRSEAEKSAIYAYANEKIVLELLEVIDNFDRAMNTAAPDDKFAEGMQLILKQLQDVLEKNNVSEIEALGYGFDPTFHNAVMTEPGEESGKVTKVLQKGYILNGKVIRPAMVAVSQ